MKRLLCIWAMLMSVGEVAAANSQEDIHIRTLASSCVICHGTAASSTSKNIIPGLAGLDEAYFINKMQAFRRSPDEHAVMVQHAKGLTEDEINQLAAYFSLQRRSCPVAKHQPQIWKPQ